MIRLCVVWSDQRVRRFTLSGHSGYASSGKDIVCAAVSALVYNAVNSCEEFLHVSLPVEDEEIFECNIVAAQESMEKVQLLVQSMIFGVRQIEKQYPGHVRVRDVREPNS